MDCLICRRNENELKRFLAKINEQLDSLINKNEKTKNVIINDFIDKHGFTTENKNKVNTINSNILNMKMDAFLSNRDSFIELESKLSILYDYIDQFRIDITHGSTINDLAKIFMNEPLEERLYELKILENESESLKNNVNTINNKPLFIEKQIFLTCLGIDEKVENILRAEISEEYSKLTKYRICIFCNELFSKESQILSSIILQEARKICHYNY